MSAPNDRPQRSTAPAPREGDRPDARDPRRVWARLLPRHGAFTRPAAVALAGWADAILHEETLEVWQAAHPDGIGLLDGPGTAVPR